MGLVMREAAVEVYVHNVPFNHVKPTWGAAQSILCNMKNFSVNSRVTKKDTGGACNTSVKNSYGKKARQLRIGALVIPAGYLLIPAGYTDDPVLLPILIKTKTLSSLSTYKVWEGVIEEWNWSMQDEEMQAEDVVVDLDPDW